MYIWICINTNNNKKNIHTECIVWCIMLTNPNMYIVGNSRVSTLLYPLLITRWSFDGHFVVLVNSSPQIWLVTRRLDQGSCMELIPYLYNKQKHCIILFNFCDVPTIPEIWVTHWANIINSIDPTMMSEEYPIMLIHGLPMILICEIMTTIKKNQKCNQY